LFERDEKFCSLIRALRYFAALGMLTRFLAQRSNPLTALPGFPAGARDWFWLVPAVLWGAFFIFILVTNRFAYGPPKPGLQGELAEGPAVGPTPAAVRALRFAVMGDCAFYSAFYVLTARVESDLFVLLLLPILAASLFLDFTSLVQTVAFAVAALTASIVVIWALGGARASVPAELSQKQWLALYVFAPRAFALFLVGIPIAWLVERHSKLDHARARYESLVESIPLMITRKDLQGVITYANKAFCDLNRLPKDEIVGRTDEFLYGEQRAIEYRAGDLRAIETKEIQHIDEKHIPYGGTEERDVEGFKIPVCDAAGKVIEVQVVFWDITDRRRREAQLEALMETTPDHIYFKDRQSRFVRICATLAKRFGLNDPSEAIGKTDFDFFAAPHAQQAKTDEEEILRTGVPKENMEERETWRDGTVSFVSTTKQCLRDKRGAVTGTFGISRDITEKKRAEAQLAASERRYRLIVEHAAEIIYTRTRAGEIRSMNVAVQAILGYSPGELIGKNILTIIAPRFREWVSTRLEGRDKRRVTAEEVDFVAKDGSIVNLEFTTRPFYDRARKEAVIVGIGHDITRRKQAEARLQDLIETNKALAGRAEANAQRLQNILEVGAHEFRAPLHTIISLLTELRHKMVGQPQDVQLLARKIENQAYRARRQADNALTLDIRSRYNFSEQDLASIFVLAQEEFEARALERSLRINVSDSAKGLPRIVMDKDRIIQVVANLMDNAVKYSLKGETINVRGKQTSTTVEFSFENRAKGIPEDWGLADFKAVKGEPAAGISSFVVGTGLGLQIVKMIVERHGGSTSFTSTNLPPDTGSGKLGGGQVVTCTIVLPKAGPPK